MASKALKVVGEKFCVFERAKGGRNKNLLKGKAMNTKKVCLWEKEKPQPWPPDVVGLKLEAKFHQ